MSQYAFNLVQAIISLAALAALIVYAVNTRRIRKAAVEQAEAGQKPCIAIEGEPAPSLTSAAHAAGKEIVEGKPRHEASYDLKLKSSPPRFLNIGSGPALKVRVRVEKMKDGQWISVSPPADLGHVVSGGDFTLSLLGLSAFPEGDDVTYRVTATYQSLSGQPYETMQVIKNRWLVDFTFRKIRP